MSKATKIEKEMFVKGVSVGIVIGLLIALVTLVLNHP